MTGAGLGARGAAAWSAIGRHPAAVGLALGAAVFVALFLLPPGNEARRAVAPERPRGRRAVRIACDDAFRAFVDGQPAGESQAWTSPRSISIPDTDTVLVAVQATNYGGPGGLVGGLLSGPQAVRAVPASWVCHATLEPGWQLPGFDDGAWKPAATVRRFGEGPWGLEPGAVLKDAEWVWAEVPVGQNETIYCRWRITGSVKPAPPAASPVDPVKFVPPATPVNAAASATLIVAADDVVQVYVDGHLAVRSDTWAAPARLALPRGKRVLIAVEARNERGPGGLIGAWRSAGGVTVPADWACRETAEPGWNQPTGDPQWRKAELLSPYGGSPWGRPAGGDLDGAAWSWTRSPAGENQTIYCRWWIPSLPGLEH